MTISTEEIRKTITERGLDCVSDVEGLELLARLERAEKERDATRAMLRAALDVLEEVKGNINPERWPTTAVNGGWKLVPVEILDRFPEINQNNYNHDDVCNLNAWGVELVLAAAPKAKP